MEKDSIQDVNKMEESNIIPPVHFDTGDIEKKLENLAEIIELNIESNEKYLDIKEEELLYKHKEMLDKEEKEKLDAEKNEETEKKIEEDEETYQNYQENTISNQEDHTQLLESLLTEYQTTNELLVENNELLEKSNELVVGGVFSIIITLVVVASVKEFINQIMKW